MSRLQKLCIALIATEGLLFAGCIGYGLAFGSPSIPAYWGEPVWIWAFRSYSGTLGFLLIVVASSIAIAWLARYPDSGSIGVFLVALALSIRSASYLVGYAVGGFSDVLEFIPPVIGLCIAITALSLIPFREYRRGMKSEWQLILVSLALVLITIKALEATALGEDFWDYYGGTAIPYFLAALVLLAAWLAILRARIGWVLVLLLCLYEVITTSLGEFDYTRYMVREPVIPALIIILLLMPPVFRWYFPRKSAPLQTTVD